MNINEDDEERLNILVILGPIIAIAAVIYGVYVGRIFYLQSKLTPNVRLYDGTCLYQSKGKIIKLYEKPPGTGRV